MKRIAKALSQFKEISAEEMHSAGTQTLRYLGVQDGERILPGQSSAEAVRPARRIPWSAVAAITAAIVIAVLIPTRIVQSAPAMLEDASGSRKIQFGEMVRTVGDKSATLSMADGSRVEARPQSEFSLERAEDGGTRIRLNRGSVAVVAAISEVRVQQGTTELRLRLGEQATSSPVTIPPAKERVAFEVVTVRPAAPAAPAAPGARGGGGANSRPTPEGCVPDSAGYAYQLDPRRFAVNRVTLFQLIAHAYPVQDVPGINPFSICQLLSRTGRISGGPDWARTDMWDLQAAIPEGSIPSNIRSAYPGSPVDIELWKLDPKVQQMLQTLLAERFKLVMRRETRETAVYLLKVGKGGQRFNGLGENYKRMVFLDTDGKPKPALEFPPSPDGDLSMIRNRALDARNLSMANWADHLFGLDGRPVLDRTGLTGRYDFHFYADAPTDSLNRDAVKAMGFELEEARVPMDVWLIVSAEKPSEN